MKAHQANCHSDLSVLGDLPPLPYIKPIGYDKAFRQGVKNSFEDELADIVLRAASLCGRLGIDLEAHLIAKILFNSTR